MPQNQAGDFQAADARFKALALPEILENIFQHLDARSMGRAAQVSLSWRDAIQRAQLWSGVTVCFIHNEYSPHMYIIAPMENLKVWDTIINMTVTQDKLQPFPMLTKLIVGGRHRTTDNTINLIVARFTNLVSLKLRGQDNLGVTDGALTKIVSCLKLLKQLDLRGCNSITDVGLKTLCGLNGVTRDRNVPTLHSLSLSGIYQLTDVTLECLRVGQPALQCLNLHLDRRAYNRFYGVPYGFTDNGMTHLAKLANLTDLDLSGTPITTDGLLKIPSCGSRLTSLTLDFCSSVDNNCGQLFFLLNHLTKLSLCDTKIGDSVLKCLADSNGVTTIDTLYLMYCPNLTNDAGQYLAKLKNLRVLNLTNSPIGDTGLIHLANAENSRIEILSFVRNVKRRMTYDGIFRVARLPRLHKMNVCDCLFGTISENIFQMPTKFARVKRLKLMRCECADPYRQWSQEEFDFKFDCIT